MHAPINSRHGSLFGLARVCAAAMLACGAAAALAAPGDTLFQDSFTTNLNQWTINASGGDASIGNETSSSGSSARLRWDTVAITSNAINANVPAARLQAWIRRGQDAFSEDPDANEDLVLEYLNASNAWVVLETFTGTGTAGEIFQRSYDVPTDALHAALRLRLTLLQGKGSDTTYWHVDDVVVTELAAPTDLGIGACETFESGLGNWTVASSGGAAGTSAATANSPTRSMYTRWGVVTVTSNPANLAGAVLVSLDVWVRRGDNAFSNRPENNENLTLEYLASGGAWALLETFTGNGTAGESFSRSYALPAAALHSGFRVRFGQTGGNGSNTDDAYWHVDDVCLSSGAVFYSLEETIWNGVGGQVLDGGSNGMNGTAIGGALNTDTTPALATNPGTCRYGVFDGGNDYVEVPDAAPLDASAELTAAAWIYMRTAPAELHTVVSKDTNYEFHMNAARQVYWWWNDSNGNVRSITSATAVPLNEWHHVAVTYQSGSQTIYIDGVVRGTATHAGTLAQNSLPFYIGTDWNFLSRAFDGYIDEVYVLPDALTQTEVQALRDRTHDCATAAAQFTINHDGFGINCVAETITVDVVDSNAGTPLLNYNAQVQLEARTPGGALAGFGTWSLVTGAGSFSDGAANDGIATYTWPLGQSQAVFSLSYTQGSSPLDIEVVQISNTGIRDTDAEGILAFSPNGFTLTAAALPNPSAPLILPFASPQTAGSSFPIHIAAYGQTPDDPVCGIIEAYTGTKSLKLWSQYDNPATGTLNVQIDGVSAAVTEAAAAAQNVAFTNGQASVTAKYKDVGQIRVAVKDDTTIDAAQLPNGIRGATAGFVVRPFDFVLSNITNAAGTLVNPQANDASGGVFVAAGTPFRVTVTVRDAEGSTTPNYGREAIPETVRLATQLHEPMGGSAPPVASTVGFGSFASGVATGSDFAWAEVGIIRLLPGVGDSSYLGAGDVTGALSERVGRFVPNHFTVVLNSPMLGTACAAGGFTYEGQAFSYTTAPVITASARAFGGAATQNYTGAFSKLTDSSLQDKTYASGGSLNVPGLPPADPAIAPIGGGNATLTFSSGSGMYFTKGVPTAPFQAGIQLSIVVRDSDGVLANVGSPSGTVTFGSPGGIAFTTGAEIRHGRLRVATAIGSERIDLPVRMVAEYYASASSGFLTNTGDSCSNNVSLAFSGFTENLAANETCARDSGAPGASGVGCPAAAALGLRFQEPPVGGDFNLRLAAPGATNNGSVLIDATVPAWLRYDWNTATGGDENPTGQATFGIFSGESRQIYTREIY